MCPSTVLLGAWFCAVLAILVVTGSSSNFSDVDNFTLTDNYTENGTTYEIVTRFDDNNATNVSRVDNETLTTTETVEISTTELPPLPDKKPPSCACDRTDICDDNCCCDSDCIVDNIHASKECRNGEGELVLDHRYCSISKPKYDLLCVAYDNLQQRHYYEKPVKIGKPNLKNVKANNPYSWTIEKSAAIAKEIVVGTHNRWKHGDILLIFDKDSEVGEPARWRFPVSLVNNLCDDEEPLHFMVDRDVSCSYSVEDVVCAEGGVFDIQSYVNFWVLTSLKEANATNDTNCVVGNRFNYSCVDVSVSLKYSYEDYRDGRVTLFKLNDTASLPRVVLDSRDNICRNAVVGVEYRIVHSGRKGIDNVTLVFELATVTLKKPVLQNFAVNFKYAKESTNRKQNPGYHQGQFLVAGGNATDNDTVGNRIISTSKFRMVHPNFAGICQPLNVSKSSLRFRTNVNVGCLLRIQLNPKDDEDTRCRKLQQNVWAHIFDFERTHMVAALAKSDMAKPEEWIKVETEGLTPSNKLLDQRFCEVVTSLQVDILYAMTGLVVNPQARIFGVLVKGLSEAISVACVSCQVLEINLKTTVSYKDLSTKPSFTFGHPPKIRASLPSDFFYPFLSNNQFSLKPPQIIIFFTFYMYQVIQVFP